jgi:hypothetical protein
MIAMNITNKPFWAADQEWSPAWKVRVKLITSLRINIRMELTGISVNMRD